MTKRYEEAERKLKLKPDEEFSIIPFTCNNEYEALDQPLVYTITDMKKCIYWEIQQHIIDDMGDDECAAVMDQLREKAKREENNDE